MPRKSLNVEGRVGGECKIRKRGCSSSSSSSLAKNYRLKRAIVVGKRAGSSTPVPTWKMGSRLKPQIAVKSEKSTRYLSISGGDKGDELSVSARKLGATLWEINEVGSPNKLGGDLEGDSRERMVKCRERNVKREMVGVQLQLSDPSHSPVSEGMHESKASRHQRRKSAISEKLQLADYNLGGLHSLHNARLMEIETQSRGGHIVGIKSRLKDVMDGLNTSKELVKVLNHIWGLEKRNSSIIKLISALQLELDRTRVNVHQLIKDQRSNHCEIEYILKQFAEEKSTWKRKEHEKIHKVIESVSGELKVERKMRKQTERLNKKLGRELADTKALLSKTVKEAESEKRAREILEQVCNELARGIGEDRAEVEEMRRESAKVREEVEKEREMLQIADVLREERVQMKLSEARYQFEEKNEAVEKLKNQLETYLGNKVSEENVDNGPHDIEKIKELEEYLRKTLNGSWANQENEKEEENGEGDDDSADSDLHSIELNMDNNSKSYNWTFANGQEDSKRTSFDGKSKGRKSIGEKTKRKSASLERKSSDGIVWEFGTEILGNRDGGDSKDWKNDCEDEIERYRMVKDLRDYILSGSRIASSQGFASPTRKLGQSLPSQDRCGVVCGSSTVLQ